MLSQTVTIQKGDMAGCLLNIFLYICNLSITYAKVRIDIHDMYLRQLDCVSDINQCLFAF